MPLKFIRFGPLAPDASEYSEGTLSEATNVLPIFGAYRPLRDLQTFSTLASAGPLTGAYAHYWQDTKTLQFARPDATDSAGIWISLDDEEKALWEQIDEVTADDSDRIAAGGAPSAAACKIRLSDVTDPASSTGHIIRWRYRVLNPSAEWTMKAELMQGASTVIATDTVTDTPAADWTQRSLTLSGAEADSITDYTDLFLRFTATVPGTAQFGRPDGDDLNSGGWLTDGDSSSNLFQQIDEVTASDTDFIKTPFLNQGNIVTYRCSLSDLTDPSTDTGYIFRYRFDGNDNNQMTLTARVKQGGTIIASQSHSVTTTKTTETLTLSSSEAAAITDHSDLYLEFRVVRGGSNIVLSLFRLYWTELEAPLLASGEVSWAEFECPDADTTYKGDLVTIHAGTATKLYTVDSSGFTDVTRTTGGDYTSPGSTSWQYASWGNDVVATNYVDPVQVLASGTANFAAAITSTAKPQARFVAVVRNHLALADINLSGHFADEVYWSAQDDRADFDVSATTQCDNQRLLQTPGQIMGLVGGEDGIIFKRNSIIRMNYVGFPFIFTFEVLSRSVGTPSPMSIVQVGDDVYFWSGSGFWVVRGGNELQRVDDSAIRKLLIDIDFSDDAIDQIEPDDPKLEDHLVTGSFDHYSRLVFWSYKTPAQNNYRHSHVLVYNPEDGRWGLAEDAGFDVSLLRPFPNIINTDRHITKGLLAFTYNGTNSMVEKFSSPTTLAGTLQGRIVFLDADKSCQVLGVKPVFTTDTNDGTWPNLTIDTDYSDDERMLTNVSTETRTTTDRSYDGFYPFSQARGRAFRFTVTIPALTQKMVKEFVGLQVKYQVQG